MLSNLKKYNIFDEELNFTMENQYDYYVKEIKLNEEIIKKIFIIDIRNMSDEMIDNIFSNFHEFQKFILSDDFYSYREFEQKKLFPYSYNMDLVFLYDKCRNYNIEKYSILNNMEYALKKFMTEEELNDILNKDYKNVNLDKEKLIDLKDRVLKLKSFNYINGNNASGKTRLLKEISKAIYVPVFSMDDIDLDLDKNILNKDYLKKYLYQLTGSYEVDKYSSYEKYIHRLSQILEFSREHNNMLLLDDLRWQSLGNTSILNLIDTLFDYSVHNEGVVITGCNQSQNIKRRVYKANIIQL